jgi:tetratricopeptide (TPR) repeat protein
MVESSNYQNKSVFAMNEKQKRYCVFFVCLTLVLTTLAVFWQLHNHEFITNFDDSFYITDNDNVKAGLTWQGIIWAFTTNHAFNWHPLTWLSHMFDCQFFGVEPGAHLLINTLFHTANATLLFFILYRMTGSLWSSAFIAAAFALHPLHVESVAWASERKDTLSTFLVMLTILSYTYYVERPCIKRYSMILLFFALCLMAKQMYVTLPFLLILLDYWPLGRISFRGQKHICCSLGPAAISFRKCILEKVPFLILSVAASVIVFTVQRQTGVMRTFVDSPPASRLANVLVAYTTYIVKMFWPLKLAACYPYPYDGLSFWYVLLSALLLLVVTSFVTWKFRRYPYLAIGWFWYIGTLVPVIGLVQVGCSAFADRYTYFPLIGLFIFITWGLSNFAGRSRKKEVVFSVSAPVIILLFGTLSWYQAKYWQNSITLFSHAAQVVENNWWAYDVLGSAFLEQSRYDEAIKNFNKALELRPAHKKMRNMVEFVVNGKLGIALGYQGKLDEARKFFNQALTIKPNDSQTNYNMGCAYMRMGKVDEAIKYFYKALTFEPDSEIYREAFKHASLVQSQKQGMIDNPNDVNSLFFLADQLAKKGESKEAIKYFNQGLKLNPESSQAHISLGYLLAGQREFDQAVEHFNKALELDPNSAVAHYFLAQALNHIGKKEEAAEEMHKALELAEAQGDSNLAESIKDHLNINIIRHPAAPPTSD